MPNRCSHVGSVSSWEFGEYRAGWRGKVRLPGQIRANDLQRFEDAGTVRGPLADGQTFSEG
jgi:hypothetical protein